MIRPGTPWVPLQAMDKNDTVSSQSPVLVMIRYTYSIMASCGLCKMLSPSSATDVSDSVVMAAQAEVLLQDKS